MSAGSADTPPPGLEIPFPWQDSVELNTQFYTALGQWHLDKQLFVPLKAQCLIQQKSI